MLADVASIAVFEIVDNGEMGFVIAMFVVCVIATHPRVQIFRDIRDLLRRHVDSRYAHATGVEP